MNNCLCSYGYNLAHNRTRLWGIRKGRARVADVSIVRYRDDPLPAVGELRLVNNKDAPIELWLIARKWLGGHDLRKVDMRRHEWDTVPLDATLWRSFWRPYWLAKRCFPAWLPLRPSRRALKAL